MSDPTKTLTLVAACAFGLEAIVKRELIAMGYDARGSQPGRVEFHGNWSDVCKTNQWLRTADRVLVKVIEFDSADFDSLFETVRDHDWSSTIPVDAQFPVTGRSRLSQLSSVPAVQRTVKKAIVESLQREHNTNELPETGAVYKIDVALLNDTATLTLDTTGDSLHKRGYRKLTGRAPIKETLAAALVDLSVWKPERMLVDPFCGTGTIPIEAAMIGMNIAPGLNRKFSCSDWPQLPAEMWQESIDDAKSKIRRDVDLQIIGSDIDEDALEMAMYHARQAGVDNQIHFRKKRFEEFSSQQKYGCIVTNPPYGERLQDIREVQTLYESFPAVLQKLETWSLFVITNVLAVEKIFQKSATRRRKLFNGRIECTYYQYLGPRPPKGYFDDDYIEPDNAHHQSPEPFEKVTPIVTTLPASETVCDTNESTANTGEREESSGAELNVEQSVNVWEAAKQKRTAKSKPKPEVAPLFGGLQAKDHEQADLFRSRLVKRARHLRRWPTKRGITCFRLYERDIPEIPLVVDRYENHLHITEYERPHERDLGRHASWLELMRTTAAEALGIDPENAHLKSRNHDSRQYEKVDNQQGRIEVQEAGLTFLVNLTDYVDTGLFLDHRTTRLMVHSEANGTRFLNLFAYTGSFTVFAADADADSTVTVDLSKNYLQWAEDNLKANKLAGPEHKFVAMDCMEYLKRCVSKKKKFDLIVVDPPTYSNSKRTDDDWDVQQRHVEMLNMIAQILTPGGVVFFSTNFRRFKFQEELLVGFNEILEISKQTVPDDFRNKRIHRCWRMEKASS
ncbi:bifunctional 23S rRNA (guanine(2069)-N(7))-methyltransferase RlmK/23S rRNA (guanine(2445)-N(2))-methyltransferase RlmL [Mariniblastus fucicola]|nr:bifunctional 23S rRNA (guanine(2069)-N(7))-methyltransferase RlmK/23S rRNA (guanine(2445)-N(2))-methyltransferase RlmL [Mariniblastus fucicola]